MKKQRARDSGFTLLEVLFVIAIVAILATIAIPAYQSFVIEGRRADGQTALENLANRMERYYQDNNTYAGATIATGNASDVLSSATSLQGFYTLSITAQDATSYTIKAARAGPQVDDTFCGDLTLTSASIRGMVNNDADATVARCW